MLKDILEQKKCFKLVCGAGNEDLDEVEKLVAIYAKAGCNFFDISANKDVLLAAKKGLARVIPKEAQGDFYFCVSVGIKGDPHIRKAQIDLAKCTDCEQCKDICPQNAISSDYSIASSCIGCARCANVCPTCAINFYSEEKNLAEILPELIKEGIDCIEFHAITEDDKDVETKWTQINACYDGVLSLCLDREKLGNEKLLARIKKLISKRPPYSTIIQADGAPMSGGEDDFKTTLQAVATAEIVQDANLPVYILLSGGTNSKTAELAKLCGIDQNGIGIGSFARKIVREFLKREDFWQNEENFKQAVKKARQLVETAENKGT